MPDHELMSDLDVSDHGCCCCAAQAFICVPGGLLGLYAKDDQLAPLLAGGWSNKTAAL